MITFWTLTKMFLIFAFKLSALLNSKYYNILSVESKCGAHILAMD